MVAEAAHVHGHEKVRSLVCASELILLQSFQMIILLYLIVIFGWALLILVIKCRKAREKRIAMAQQEG